MLLAAHGGGPDDDADGGGEEGREVGEAVAYVDSLQVWERGAFVVLVRGLVGCGSLVHHVRHFAGFVCGDVDACFLAGGEDVVRADVDPWWGILLIRKAVGVYALVD